MPPKRGAKKAQPKKAGRVPTAYAAKIELAKKLQRFEKRAGYSGKRNPATRANLFLPNEDMPRTDQLIDGLVGMLGEANADEWIDAIRAGADPVQFANTIHRWYINYFGEMSPLSGKYDDDSDFDESDDDDDDEESGDDDEEGEESGDESGDEDDDEDYLSRRPRLAPGGRQYYVPMDRLKAQRLQEKRSSRARQQKQSRRVTEDDDETYDEDDDEPVVAPKRRQRSLPRRNVNPVAAATIANTVAPILPQARLQGDDFNPFVIEDSNPRLTLAQQQQMMQEEQQARARNRWRGTDEQKALSLGEKVRMEGYDYERDSQEAQL